MQSKIKLRATGKPATTTTATATVTVTAADETSTADASEPMDLDDLSPSASQQSQSSAIDSPFTQSRTTTPFSTAALISSFPEPSPAAATTTTATTTAAAPLVIPAVITGSAVGTGSTGSGAASLEQSLLVSDPAYITLTNTLAVLQQQREQALRDLDTLQQKRDEALADPAKFVASIVSGGPSILQDTNGNPIAPPQQLQRLPDISMAWYVAEYERSATEQRDKEIARAAAFGAAVGARGGLRRFGGSLQGGAGGSGRIPVRSSMVNAATGATTVNVLGGIQLEYQPLPTLANYEAVPRYSPDPQPDSQPPAPSATPWHQPLQPSQLRRLIDEEVSSTAHPANRSSSAGSAHSSILDEIVLPAVSGASTPAIHHNTRSSGGRRGAAAAGFTDVKDASAGPNFWQSQHPPQPRTLRQYAQVMSQAVGVDQSELEETLAAIFQPQPLQSPHVQGSASASMTPLIGAAAAGTPAAKHLSHPLPDSRILPPPAATLTSSTPITSTVRATRASRMPSALALQSGDSAATATPAAAPSASIDASAAASATAPHLQPTSPTHNVHWSAQEQADLDRLLHVYGPEEVAMDRYRKISAAMHGRRTAQQISSRIHTLIRERRYSRLVTSIAGVVYPTSVETGGGSSGDMPHSDGSLFGGGSSPPASAATSTNMARRHRSTAAARQARAANVAGRRPDSSPLLQVQSDGFLSNDEDERRSNAAATGTARFRSTSPPRSTMASAVPSSSVDEDIEMS
ncbi:hypothetical protein GQ42DRAFT_165020 [Ramicandelaber brevisporus]|nr:hypothetical protein GQ42DRAFT_165020 [Ramicandelaber brevisporus]